MSGCVVVVRWTVLELGLNPCRALEGMERSSVSRPVGGLQGTWGKERAGFQLGYGGGGKGSRGRVPVSLPQVPNLEQVCLVGVIHGRAGASGRGGPWAEEVQAPPEFRQSLRGSWRARCPFSTRGWYRARGRGCLWSHLRACLPHLPALAPPAPSHPPPISSSVILKVKVVGHLLLSAGGGWGWGAGVPP